MSRSYAAYLLFAWKLAASAIVVIAVYFLLDLRRTSRATNYFSLFSPSSSGGKIPSLALQGANSSETFSESPHHVTAAALLPQLYQSLDEDELTCKEIYGSSYLTYAASHHVSICESSSGSHVRCFQARRPPLPFSWPFDQFCVAQGVSIVQDQITSSTKFGLQCRIRQENSNSPTEYAKTNSSKSLSNVLEPKSYFFSTGVESQLRDWNTTIATPTTRCSRDGHHQLPWMILIRREGNNNIFHNFMEIWQAMLTVDALQAAIDPETGEPFLSNTDLQNARIVFEDDRNGPYDDWWGIVLHNGEVPLRKSNLESGCYPNVILPLPGSSSPFWSLTMEVKYHNPCHNEVLTNAVRKRMFEHLGVVQRSTEDIVHVYPNITIIDRKETRAFFDLPRLVTSLKAQHPSSQINVVDFAQISLKQQVQLAIDTDILVGAHGSAFLHILWMQPDAAVVEFKPTQFPGQGFRYFAGIRGVNYFEGRATWPEVWNDTVHGTGLPENWKPPVNGTASWQKSPFVYVLPDEFLGVVGAAVRSQQNKEYAPGLSLSCSGSDCQVTKEQYSK
ncbi:MAG: hypothetical protein Q9227_007977 [Pyrenula ochraceoflavens]